MDPERVADVSRAARGRVRPLASRHRCAGRAVEPYDRSRLRIVEDGALPLVGVSGVHRHVSGARTPRAQQRRDELGPPWQADADAVTLADAERPRGASARVAAGDVCGQRDRSHTDRVAVLEPVVDARRRVSEDPDPGEGPQRQEPIGVVAAGGKGVGACVAGPQPGTRRLLEHCQPAPVVRVRLRVQEHFHVPDVEAELRNARHD